MDDEPHALYRKRDAVLRRYKRTGENTLLDQFLKLRKVATDATKRVRTDYVHKRLKKTLDDNDNFWKEFRNLGLLPKSAEGLQGFSLNDLNNHFAAVSCSSSESPDEAINIVNTAPDEGFTFKHVSLNDVILAVAHFTSQGKGKDGIPQSVVAKAPPTIGPLLVNLFNTSFDNGIFPEAWRKAQLIPLKKKSVPTSPADFRLLLCSAFSLRFWRS